MMHQNHFGGTSDGEADDIDEGSGPDEDDPDLEQGEYTFENGAVYSG